MTEEPDVFGSHYFTEMLASGSGHFPSDTTLMTGDTLAFVRTRLKP